MNRDARSIERDLKQRISGEVLFDDISRILFGTAACIYQVKPLGVVVPRNVEDVAAVVRYCSEHDIPITSRGAGTSLAGQSIGSGIILVFNKYFRGILAVNPEERSARVQPGVVLDQLNKTLRTSNHQSSDPSIRHSPEGILRRSPFGHSDNIPLFHYSAEASLWDNIPALMFGPDPSSGKQCVIGGMIGTNAAGAHTVKYGATKDNILELKIVTADGEVRTVSETSNNDDFARKTFDLLSPHRDLIQKRFPKSQKNSCGYNLHDALGNDGIDLTKLLCGSEGTLGITVEAKLKLTPLPAERRNLIAYFPSYESCAAAANESLQFKPAAVEMLDKTFANAALGLDPRIDELLEENFVSILIFEFEEGERGLAEDKIRKLSEHLNKLRLPSKQILPRDEKEAAKLWRVRKEASSIFYKIEKPGKKTSVVEDAAVPVEKLPDYLAGAQEIFKHYKVQYALYGHAGSGNTHALLLLDLKNRDHLRKIEPLANEVYNLAISLGGTLSGEHGDGFLRTPFLSRLYGEEVYSLFRKVKEIFDPKGILNPGKIIGEQGTSIVHDLRYGENYNRIETRTSLSEEKIAHEIEKCHGCGACLSYCPTALATFDERATPRAKGNILRAVISGNLDSGFLAQKEFKDVLDYCFNCKLCLSECPTQIDIPGIVIEAKTIFFDRTERSAQDKFIDHLPALSAAASVSPTLANVTSNLNFFRKPLEKLFGIDSRRQLPLFQKPLYKRFLRTKTPDKPQKKVVYFAGCFANFNDVAGEGIATVEVLRRNNVDVRVLDSLRCCGIARITTGSRNDVVEDAQWNIEQMMRYIEDGFEVVASAPSCALALKEDYPKIIKNGTASEFSSHVHELSHYLYEMYENGELNTNFGEVKKRVTYHNPCHSVPFGVKRQPIELMKLIPGLEVIELSEDTCCGMAGTFGMKEQFYDLSMKIGSSLFKNIKSADVDEVVTTCGTCNMQIAQGAKAKVVHLAKILFEAYRRFDGKSATASAGNSKSKISAAHPIETREAESLIE
ncbi:MAG: anaerobic glycerol-3-phosphate dehydrogenase subunit C [Bacteroidetes bacterium]|nr:anaerobic glycerol-3-phosphate dehydrogenase subunit C [Bacteroidota bacterium]